MCGIVGYVGPDEALPIVLEGLRRLEYRGYDSAGVAVRGGRAAPSSSAPASSRSSRRRSRARSRSAGHTAMGHTRWATHGAPTDRNAHPHLDCHGRIAVIHNGIIENFQTLRARLEKDGHVLASDTDTECIAHLIEEHVRDEARARRRGARDRPRAPGRVRARRGVGGRARSPRRGEGLLAARRGPGRRRDAAGLRHPRRARPHDHRDPGRGRTGRRGPARRRRVHRLRRERAAPDAHRGGLGRGSRAEGRVRRLHAEGDPRAARRRSATRSWAASSTAAW